jgi:predicted metal-binding membrane protein
VIASAPDAARTGGLAPALAAVRDRVALVAGLLALAGVGWWWTVDQMQGMDNGPWTGLGTLGWFIGIWVVMMAAMMLPAVAPTIALYARMTSERPMAAVMFGVGYLVTWAAAGLAAFQRGQLDRGTSARLE